MTEDLRQQRHESRAAQTWTSFLADLRAETGLDAETATNVATSVLLRLEQRLTGGEVKDLEAQLPVKLRELLADAGADRDSVFKFHREHFVDCVSGDLGASEPAAEALIRAVFATVRRRISEGEADDVEAQLPNDLKPLWRATI